MRRTERTWRASLNRRLSLRERRRCQYFVLGYDGLPVRRRSLVSFDWKSVDEACNRSTGSPSTKLGIDGLEDRRTKVGFDGLDVRRT